MTDPTRYARKLERQVHRIPATGCVEWQAGRNRQGYGVIWVPPNSWLAHRFAWFLAHGPIPDGLCVCHHCDNPPCCNVDHLFLGTIADNNADMLAKGHYLRGTENGNGRLTSQDVRAIRERRLAGERGVDVAAAFGITPQAVCNILKGRKRARD